MVTVVAVRSIFVPVAGSSVFHNSIFVPAAVTPSLTSANVLSIWFSFDLCLLTVPDQFQVGCFSYEDGDRIGLLLVQGWLRKLRVVIAI